VKKVCDVVQQGKLENHWRVNLTYGSREAYVAVRLECIVSNKALFIIFLSYLPGIIPEALEEIISKSDKIQLVQSKEGGKLGQEWLDLLRIS